MVVLYLLLSNVLASLLHEAAHLLVATICGVRVAAVGLMEPLFGLDLRIPLGRLTIHIGLLPFGGFTRLVGMPAHLRPANPAADTLNRLTAATGDSMEWTMELTDVATKVLDDTNQPGSLAEAPLRAQQAIIAAGIVANALAAAVVAALLLSGLLPANPFWLALFAMNLVDAIWNAIPLPGHDGDLLIRNHVHNRTR